MYETVYDCYNICLIAGIHPGEGGELRILPTTWHLAPPPAPSFQLPDHFASWQVQARLCDNWARSEPLGPYKGGDSSPVTWILG